MDQNELKKNIEQYEAHLRKTAATFNAWAKEKKLPVTMNPDHAIEAVKSGVGLAAVAPFWEREDDTGVVHETQIKTAIECILNLLNDSKRCGHVVGAMQSGKTTTSLAMQWAGPILYLLTGQRTYPFYIIGSQTNHEDQTKIELDRFIAFYGHVEFRPTQKKDEERKDVDPMFKLSSSLETYRRQVLKDALKDTLEVPQLEDLVHRRVGGEQSLKKIADLCRRAADGGYRSLMIIDEPQFGASDHIVVNENGTEQRKCVLAQIFDRIEKQLGDEGKGGHWFVGLSATPFELNDLNQVWEVRQYLGSAYSGFNYFNDRPIDNETSIEPPKTMSLSLFAESIATPFLAKVVMSAYDGNKSAAFPRNARKLHYENDQTSYQREVEDALRRAIYALLDQYRTDPDWPIGLCIRAFNNNMKTKALISSLGLDDKRIEVIDYYGSEVSGISVKRAIAQRKHPELPYLIFVTNRARMADSFPAQVRFFMDFGQKASDLNALLQGLLGRACGYNKKSTVVLSDANAGIVDAYVATKGGYVYKTSRHSITVGGFRRGAPSGMIKLRNDMDDDVVKKFFERVDKEVVDLIIPPGSTKLQPKRAKGAGNFRTGPFLLIAEDLKLFDHIEDPAIRTTLFPQIPTGFHIARRDDRVHHSHKPGVTLGYSLDDVGNCRYTFRWSDRESAAQGGAAGRAKGKRDTGQHMEPTVYVEKYDSKTKEIINDRTERGEKKPGNWRAFMVTFPLTEPVREIKAAELAYPIARSPYSDLMDPSEKEARDLEEKRRANEK